MAASSRNPSSSVPSLAVGIGAAARAAGLGRTTLWRHLRDGTGPKVIQLGSKRVIRLEALDAWLRSLEEARVTTPRKGAKS
jgi:predicted DNA-binding transcriptional regulator AlpA